MRVSIVVGRLIVFGMAAGAIHSSRASEMGASFSGVYDFEGIGKARPGVFSSPLIDFRQLKLSSKIEITDAGSNSVLVKYMRPDGTPAEQWVDLGRSGYGRQNGAVEYEVKVAPVGAKILPGHVVQLKKLVFKKDAQGNLEIKQSVVEKGFMLYLIPFSETHQSVLTLQRASDRLSTATDQLPPPTRPSPSIPRVLVR